MLRIRPDLQERLKERWEAPQVFENVVDQKDLDFLLNEEKNNQSVRILTKRVFGLDTLACQRYLDPVLKKVLKYPFKITGGNFFRTEIPYMLHADTGIDVNCALYRIVVFPLYLETFEGTKYHEEFNGLSIMHQRWYNQAAFFMKGEEHRFDVKKQEYNQPVNDYSIADGITDVPFDRERYEAVFSHLNYKSFEGMSELAYAPWRIGNAITFDRSNIHTATNFIKANVKMKIGLTFFTEYGDL